MPTEHKRRRCLRKVVRFIRQNLLVVLLLIAMLVGIGLGSIFRTTWSPLEKRKIAYLKFPGDIMLNMLQMVSLPLIVSSIVSSLSLLRIRTSSKIGLRTLGYYLVTTLCAVLTGIISVVTIHPGRKTSNSIDAVLDKADPVDSVLDMIRNSFPSNLIEACIFKKRTKVMKKIIESGIVAINSTNDISGLNTTKNHVTIDVPSIVTVPGVNVMGLIVFSIFVGCILSSMEDKSKPLADFFHCVYQVMMKMIMVIIWFTPIGLVFVIAASVVQTENPADVIQELAVYIPAAICCLLLHAFGTLPLTYFLVTRKNPYRFLINMSKAIITAFGTSSSAATLPFTMDCLIQKNHISSEVVNFITPIGATVNMDGTALYISMLTIFISQRLGISMDFGKYIIIGLTAIGTSIGAAAVPNSGLAIMSLGIIAAGLPPEQILLIAPIDWVFERFRTMVNVIGDAFGAGIVAHICSSLIQDNRTLKDDLKKNSFIEGNEENEELV